MRHLSFVCALSTATALGLSLAPLPARAFSTRIHILLANKVRESLLQRGDGSVPLRFGPHAARLSKEDAAALMDNPLAFRAGAIGPDNMVFPGMTDPSHAIEQRPFEQCELLYRAALTSEERAYAMGCFLHGVTDAVAHHYVNYMSGETFTLTPLKDGRKTGYSNVVRHIIAESMIQKAAFQLDPGAFREGQLAHTIPTGFLLRAYFDEASPLWQLVARRAKEKYDEQVAKMPDAALPTVLAALPVAPADHLVLTPVYLRSVDGSRQKLRESVVSAIAAMQNQATADGAQLKVTAGNDGKLGTSDDKTACTVGCAALYAKYFTYVALLSPRYDAGNRPLPSAFDKISEKLRGDLFALMPAYLKTVQNLSAKLNTPLSAANNDFDLSSGDLAALFAPLDAWVNNLTTLDYETVARAVAPDWLLQLQDALKSVGINVDLSGILRALFEPIIRPIKDSIKAFVLDQAKAFLGDLANEYKRDLDAVLKEYEDRLTAAAPEGQAGTALSRLFESGLYGHAFNFAAAALSNHAAALPLGEDPVGIGPASFDASYTPTWSQVGLCGYLRAAVFPLGIDVRGSLSLRDEAGRDLTARVAASDDSPVECHDGSLAAFSKAPGPAACALTDVTTLVSDPAHRGTLTRAYPPLFAAQAPTCQDLRIDGLPEPPPPPPELPMEQGCGCRVGGAGGEGGEGLRGALLGGLLLGGLLLGGRRRGQRRAARGAGRRNALVVALLLGGGVQQGCAPSEMGMEVPDGGDAPDLGVSKRQQLLSALHRSVWHGKQIRAGVERAYELQFDSQSFLWAEIRNPFGPSRRRELRAFSLEEDGQTAHSTVASPLTWPDAAEIGRKDDWRVELVPGTPRKLRLQRGGLTEEFDEGPWPRPEGMTATVRVFPSGGAVDKAFCSSAANGFKYATFLDFARGRSAEPLLGKDTVAGARLLGWHDGTGQNRFAVTDLDGFASLGRTELSDQYNFFVSYRGLVRHPGGRFQLREKDDTVEDGLWAFRGDKLGSSNTADIFLEVHGFIWADLTGDEPSATLPAGDVPVEVVLVRCAKQIKDVDVQLRQGDGAYKLLGEFPTQPIIDDTLFPPAL